MIGIREYLIAGLALACLLLGVGWYAERAGHAVTKATFVAEKATAAREFSQAARAAEQKEAEALNRIAQSYDQGKRDAEAEGKRVVADLRAGNLRLQRHWQGCQATAERVSETLARTREPDAAEQSRRESAGRIVRAAAECDAQVAELQKALKARQ